jgi:hypothetical protein
VGEWTGTIVLNDSFVHIGNSLDLISVDIPPLGEDVVPQPLLMSPSPPTLLEAGAETDV